jgi:hypothetical protein
MLWSCAPEQRSCQKTAPIEFERGHGGSPGKSATLPRFPCLAPTLSSIKWH